MATSLSPTGFPRITPGVYYREAGTMIAWLCDAFGFTVRLKVEGDAGEIMHSELVYGDGVIMVGGERAGPAQRFGMDMVSPATAFANTQNLMVYVDDVDAHCAHARSKGAVIADEPAVHDYGDDYWADRSYGARDPEGHVWWFTQRIRG
jgi:uncharacterized glyoxalase superfamily protein PhnB